MSRLPEFRRNDLRHDVDPQQVDRLWSRVRDDLPARSAWNSSGARAKPIVDGAHASRSRVAIVGAFALAAAFAGGLWFGRALDATSPSVTASSVSDRDPADVFATASKARTFALPGGGKLALEPDSLVEIVNAGDQDGSGLTLHLLRGAASLDVTSADVGVAVLAGEARVSAPAGASVSLSRRTSDVDVVVSHGSVEVTSPAGRHTVHRGQALAHVPTTTRMSVNGPVEPIGPSPFEAPQSDDASNPDALPNPEIDNEQTSPLATSSLPNRVAVTTSQPQLSTATTTSSEPPAASWIKLASTGYYEAAYDQLGKRSGLANAIDNAQSARELTYLSEVAAAVREQDLNLRALRRVADEFGASPEAATAAVELARYYEATDKTLAAKYRDMAKSAPAFNESALCSELRELLEEVTSTSTQTNTIKLDEAKQKADEYLAKYPKKGSCSDVAQDLLAEVSVARARTPTSPNSGSPNPGASASASASGSTSVSASSSASGAPSASNGPSPQTSATSSSSPR